MVVSNQAARLNRLEQFSLAVVTLRSTTSIDAVEVPVVDGWIELRYALAQPPSAEAERAFLRSLAGLRARLDPKAWFLLHKAPGLKLRLRTGEDASRVAEAVEGAAALSNDWLTFDGCSAFFDQAELRPLAFRDDCDAWLSAAADALLAAAAEGQRTDQVGVAGALVDWTARLTGGDLWLAHELLARFARLRLGANAPGGGGGPAPFDLKGLGESLPASHAPGFEASVSALQTLNLTMNLWGVDASLQSEALTLALARTRPALEPAARP